ncbi:MAG: hypothetical protein Kapaf2KO_01470 [Candidatus Kapaibacteriales bacterium]
MSENTTPQEELKPQEETTQTETTNTVETAPVEQKETEANPAQENVAPSVESLKEETAPVAKTDADGSPSVGSKIDLDDIASQGVTEGSTAAMNEALKAEPTPEELEAREEAAKVAAAKKEENTQKYQQFKSKVGTEEVVEVSVVEKVRGGLRVESDGFLMFMPVSLISGSRVEDSDIESMVGSKANVLLVDSDDSRESIVVSRKQLIEQEAYDKINVGDTVKGKVTSVPSFGVFVDLGGVEGLIHISRIAHERVEKPSDVFKVGDEVEAKIIEINKKKGNIALSRKALLDSPWKGISDEFAEGSTHKGQVKAIQDFGAYIEMKPGIDGLVRLSEFSWTKRTNSASEEVTVGDEVEFYVMKVNEDKKQADLSIKRLTTDPWEEVPEKYKIGETYKATVNEIVEKGCRVQVGGEIAAFMPKGRMRPVLKNNTIPYTPGQEVDVVVIDIDTEKGNMFVAPKVEGREFKQDDNFGGGRGRGGNRKSEKIPKEHDGKQSGSFSLGDMLGDILKQGE